MECLRDWRNYHDLHVRSCYNGCDSGRLIVGNFQKILPRPNCPGCLNVGEVRLHICRQKSRKPVDVATCGQRSKRHVTIAIFKWRSRRHITVAICRWKSRKAVTVAILLGAKISKKEWTSGQLRAWEFSGRRYSQKEELPREQFSVLERKSDLEKVLGLSWLWEDAQTFFLGLQWAC